MFLSGNYTISIAMCTYNGANFLQKQLDSLGNQQLLPDELVVCDDGSTDSTIAILNNFTQAAPFSVKIIQNDCNLGFVRNFEKCSQYCSGDIIFFCDQDDIWKPEKIKEFIEIFEREPDVGLVLSDAELIDQNDCSLNSLYSQGMGKAQKLTRIIHQNPARFVCELSVASWAGMSMAYRSRYNNILFPYPNTDYHDAWTLQTLCAVTQARMITDPLVCYRIHENNQAGTDTNTLVKQIHSFNRDKVLKQYKAIEDNLNCIIERLEKQSEYVVSPDRIRLYQAKANHCRMRYLIGSRQVNRFYGVMHELFNYFRFGRGLLSIVSDLLM